MTKSGPFFKIRQVIELTGVSEFLLRVWEDRYLALSPSRTKTGRRLYSENDVLRARALFALTQKGHRIGDIAKLSLPKLNQFLEPSPASAISSINASNQKIQEIMAFANKFDWKGIQKLVHDERRKLEALDWIRTLIIPLLLEMGRLSDAGKLSIAQEHILSAIIKESLASRLATSLHHKWGPRIVLATPEGDYHDLGLLVAERIAIEYQFDTLYLGSHMPKDELAAVCLRFQATHLLLSSTSDKKDGAKDHYFEYVNFLDRNLNPKLTLWLGGKNAQKHSISLGRPFKTFSSFESFELELKKSGSK